jgi:hypothetical protein
VDGKPGPAPSSCVVASVTVPSPMHPGQPPEPASPAARARQGTPGREGGHRHPTAPFTEAWAATGSSSPRPTRPSPGREGTRPVPNALRGLRLPGARPGRRLPDSSGRSTPSHPRTESVFAHAAARPQGPAPEGRGNLRRGPLRRNAPRDRGSHALRRRRSGGHRKGSTTRRLRFPSTASGPAPRIGRTERGWCPLRRQPLRRQPPR